MASPTTDLSPQAPPAHSAPRTRDRRLDVAKGVLIAAVVLGHFLETSGGRPPGHLYSGWSHEPQAELLTLFYLFHMPLFVLLAGITARSSRIADRVTQMLCLYVVMQVAWVGLRYLVDGHADPTLLHPTYGLWFLQAMAWWLLLLPLVQRFPRSTLALSILLAVGSGVVTIDGSLLSWQRTLYFWPFFVVGQLAGQRVLRRTSSLPRPALAGAVVVPTAIAVAYRVVGLDPSWIRGDHSFASLDVGTLHGVALRVLALGLASVCGLCVLSLIPARAPAVETVGRRSLAVYAVHLGMVVVLEQLFEREHARLGNAVCVGLAFLFTAGAIALLSRRPVDAAVRKGMTAAADKVLEPVRG